MKINDLLKTINEICKNIVKVYVVMSHTTTEEKCGMGYTRTEENCGRHS